MASVFSTDKEYAQQQYEAYMQSIAAQQSKQSSSMEEKDDFDMLLDEDDDMTEEYLALTASGQTEDRAMRDTWR